MATEPGVGLESDHSESAFGDAACIVATTLRASAGSGLFSKLHGLGLPSEPNDLLNDDQRQPERDQGPQASAPRASPSRSSASTGTTAASSNTSSLAASNAAALDQVRRAATCGLCSSLVAGSLVLSCGHQFCGGCLIDHLNQKPLCPSCQVGLRAIPVRCLALDGVAEALGRVLGKSELEAYHARAEEGKSAANKINKMFWWLQPAAIPTLGDPQAQNCDANGNGSSSSAAAAAAAAMALAGGASRVRGPATSCGGAAPPPARQQQPQRATMDQVPAGPQPLPTHVQMANLQQQQQQGGPLLPAFLDAIGVQPPQHPIYEDGGFAGGRALGGQSYHRDPPRTPFFAPNGARLPKPAQSRNNYSSAPLPGGVDASHLVNMGLNPPLMSSAMVQQHRQQQMAQMSFFDYNAAASQLNLPPANAAQMQYLPDYGLGAQVGQGSAQEHMANLHAQAQLQQLLNSLAIAEMYPV